MNEEDRFLVCKLLNSTVVWPDGSRTTVGVSHHKWEMRVGKTRQVAYFKPLLSKGTTLQQPDLPRFYEG